MDSTDDHSEFEIIQINADLSEDLEPLGARPKFWFTFKGTRTLFKADNRNTGEDWAEVICAAICDLLGIPHVPYRLAHDTRNDLPGVLCANIASKPLTLILGNQLMVEVDPNYPMDDETKYGVTEHTVEGVAHVIKKLAPPPNNGSWRASTDCHSALEVFVGYVMLDTLVANQDRHHQNWGALRDRNQASWLAPTFDHGAGLARNEPELKRERRLGSKDRKGEMLAYAQRAKSGFYGATRDQKTLHSLDCFLAWREQSPTAATYWLSQLAKISEVDFRRIIDRIPQSRMTPIAKEFTIALLLTNKNRLLSVQEPTETSKST